MLTSFFIPKLQCRCFYPHLTFALSDDWNFSERFCGATVPYYDDTPEIFDFFSSVNDSKNGNNTTSLSVQFGDFVKVYGSLDRSSSFDVVVTSFFIDTARDIYEYLAVIKNVLKPGGLWINSGPLHYHQRDAIPYSHEHLLSIFALFGFRVLNQQIITTSYCGDEFVKMKPEMYVIPLNVMQLEQLNSEVFEEIFENNEKPFASVNFITK
jgi:SAM-dependent methyltransferase